MKTGSPDIIITIITSLFGGIGLTMCFYVSLIGFALLAWWGYGTFFSKTAKATVTGIRAYQKDTTIEHNKEVKTTPYAMYSPILSCEAESGALSKGYLSSSQNWIPARWLIGSKIVVLEGIDPESYNEKPSNIILLIAILIFMVIFTIICSIPKNIYVYLVFAFFMMRMLIKLARIISVPKIIAYFKEKNFADIHKDIAAKRNDFKIQRKKDNDTKWETLNILQLNDLLAAQKSRFYRYTLPFMSLFAAGMIGIAYKIGTPCLTKLARGDNIIDIAKIYTAEFTVSSVLFVCAVYILLSLVKKAITLPGEQNETPVIF